jgi:transcriptional regulator with XRE-family HTH domain
MARRNDQVTKINKFIGSKLYHLRIQAKLSRRKISDVIGVSQQQLGKYESGINHISAGRLFVIAEVLGKRPEFFYAGLDEYLYNIQQNELENANSLAADSKYLMHQIMTDIKKANTKKRKPTKRLIELVSCNNRNQRSNSNSTKNSFDSDESLELECA